MLLGLRTAVAYVPDLAAARDGHAAGLAGTLAYWGVEDVQADVDHAVSKGASVHQAPGDVGGGITVGVVRDPWGNAVGFIRNPHFDPARVR